METDQNSIFGIGASPNKDDRGSALKNELKIKDKKNNIEINEDSDDDNAGKASPNQESDLLAITGKSNVDPFRHSTISGDKMSNSFRVGSG